MNRIYTIGIVSALLVACSSHSETVQTISSPDIKSSTYCYGVLPETPNWSFSYLVDSLSNGNIAAYADVSDGEHIANAVVEYNPNQNAYLNGDVVISMDAYPPVNAGWWDVSLDRSTMFVNVVYHDVDMPYGGNVWMMRCEGSK